MTKQNEIAEKIKECELKEIRATTDSERENAKNELRALWRAFARTGAGYSRKNAKRIA